MKFLEEYHPLLEMIKLFKENEKWKLSHDLRPGDVIFVYDLRYFNGEVKTIDHIGIHVVIEASCKSNLLELRTLWKDGLMECIFPTLTIPHTEDIEYTFNQIDDIHHVCRIYFTFKKDK